MVVIITIVQNPSLSSKICGLAKPREWVTVKNVLAANNRGSSEGLVDRCHLTSAIFLFIEWQHGCDDVDNAGVDYDGGEGDLFDRPGNKGGAGVRDGLATAGAESGLDTIFGLVIHTFLS